MPFCRVLIISRAKLHTIIREIGFKIFGYNYTKLHVKAKLRKLLLKIIFIIINNIDATCQYFYFDFANWPDYY